MMAAVMWASVHQLLARGGLAGEDRASLSRAEATDVCCDGKWLTVSGTLYAISPFILGTGLCLQRTYVSIIHTAGADASAPQGHLMCREGPRSTPTVAARSPNELPQQCRIVLNHPCSIKSMPIPVAAVALSEPW